VSISWQFYHRQRMPIIVMWKARYAADLVWIWQTGHNSLPLLSSPLLVSILPEPSWEIWLYKWQNLIKNFKCISITTKFYLSIFCTLSATDWMVWGSNPGGSKILHTHPDQPWDPPSLLYNGYWVSLPAAKQLKHGIDFKERVQWYPYSPFGSSWPVLA